MEKQQVEQFQGPKGSAEVWELVSRDSIGREKIEYEVVFAGERTLLATMGEASVLACELSGDPRFPTPGPR